MFKMGFNSAAIRDILPLNLLIAVEPSCGVESPPPCAPVASPSAGLCVCVYTQARRRMGV